MKMFSVLLLTLSFNTFAKDLCHTIVKDYKFEAQHEVLSTKNADYTKAEWSRLPVLFDFDYKSCIPTQSVKRSVVQLESGIKLEIVKTNDDICDGGNTYGFVRNLESSEVVAHIYDYDFYCKEDWRN